MKTILLSCCAALMCISAVYAQDKDTTENLFDGSYEHGGFGGPAAKIVSLNGSVNVMTGAWGAWLIDHRLALGGGWFSTASPHNIGDSLEMDMEYSGFTAEYIFEPQSLVHYSLQLTIGGGSVDFSRPAVGNISNNLADDVFFVVEPGVNAEINLLQFMRMHVGASYRFVSGMDNNRVGVTNSDIGGPSLNFTLKFGKF